MMLALAITNAACCAVAAWLLLRLSRPALVGPAESFASILGAVRSAREPAAAQPPRCPTALAIPTPVPTAPAAPAPRAGQAPAPVADVTLSKRMAIIRHMLQGRSASEVAAVEAVEAAAVRSLYRSHGRLEG